jgi:hypothetical protein
MSKEVFQDELGQAIKTRLMNYALEKNKDTDIEKLERHIENTATVVQITREAIIEALKAESEVLIFKQTFQEAVPTLFISGVLHALDVIQGNGSVMGR